ncbi:Sec-independent protein translocase subunit TatB [Paraburkholderia sp. RP-4-7]|uniref:Sec-independent protein translocase protein TatB n=1 Tax=Paraburkholderia polaris TaxID=2728848 RepID=A0A848IRZ5_9BURK|nr:Sec-independent protein translocase protein TatB [Paraburkholderia polaris]NMM04461.1 Sec-independent protein translocase subunit TatB [Paraburkholderia polaris]
MLDLGLMKIALIGVIALVVLGPERLPGVARTAGALFGRAQRYINDVTAEVSREIDVAELKKARTKFETAAANVESKIHDNLRRHENELNRAWDQGASVSERVAGGGDPNLTHASRDTRPSNSDSTFTSSASRSKRGNWRLKRSAVPNCYKRTTLRKTRMQSGAPRVARHRPETLRRPTRFL